MNTHAHNLTQSATLATPAWSGFERWLRNRLVGQLQGLQGGTVSITDALGTLTLGESSGAAQPLHVHAKVHAPDFYRQIAMNGSVGAGEAYMDGWWECDDLVALVRLLVRNRDLLDGMETGLARLGGMAMRGLHTLKRNTRLGSRRNIAAHYDLGNQLFALFLDQNMMYSSAIFAAADESIGTESLGMESLGAESLGAESLERASRRKLDRICRKLDLCRSDRVIEIGTGWGGFALYAAQHYGCHVTTATISREQYDLARQRIAAAGLQDRVTVLLQDYRDLRGTYDKLVSIEMIEAIGSRYLNTYFEKCAALLAPDGLALIQAITIEDHRYRQALRSVDFIKRHVFPGSFIPCVSAILGASARASDLRLINLEDIGPSYAITLRHWRRRFLANLDAVRKLGYDERFVRMWEYYLCYCEGGFLERSIGNAQLLLARPGNRRAQFVPD